MLLQTFNNMNHPSQIKTLLFNFIMDVLHEKINDANAAISSAKESRDSDTKSSAGDKYETGRAMMQQEIEKNEMQLNSAMNQLQEISRIDLNKKFMKVETGCVVITDSGKYFISIGIGKILLEEEHYFAISLASPIGLLLKNKTAGDTIQFQEKQITVTEIF